MFFYWRSSKFVEFPFFSSSVICCSPTKQLSFLAEEISPSSDTAKLGGVNPIFCVSNLQDSFDYYRNALGFKLDFLDPGILASISRGQCQIFLCQGDQSHPGGWAWIGAGDIEPLCQEFFATGAKLRHPPTNYSWAYEIQIEDPDGNVLRFGSNSKRNQPIGQRLDMHGQAWATSPPGRWSRFNRP